MDISQKQFRGEAAFRFYPRVYVSVQCERRLWVRSSPLNWKREELQRSLSLELEKEDYSCDAPMRLVECKARITRSVGRQSMRLKVGRASWLLAVGKLLTAEENYPLQCRVKTTRWSKGIPRAH
jgi:hypothetical protein